MKILQDYNAAVLTADRLVRERERLLITSISRTQAYQLEKQGRFPARRRLGARSVCWKLSELLEWVEARGMETINE